MRVATIPARTKRAISVFVVTGLMLAGCSGGQDTPGSTESSGGDSQASSAPADGGNSGGDGTQTQAPAAGEPTQIDSFSWGISPGVAHLDYAQAHTFSVNQTLANICESLHQMQPDLSNGPGLAESVDKPDSTTLIYHVRANVSFHDGSIMTADDVVASLNRQLDPAVASVWTGYLENVESIEATGPLEVTVKLTKPDPLFDEAMGSAAGVVESAKTLAEAGDQYGSPEVGVNCTGPYSLASYKTGDQIVLDRFDDYWDKDNVGYAKQVVFRFFDEPQALTNAAATGEIDGIYRLPLEGHKQLLEATDAGSLDFSPSVNVVNVIASNPDGPMGDVRVRKALMHAIDRNALVQATYQDRASVAKSPAPLTAWQAIVSTEQAQEYLDALDNYDYDLDTAKQLVADAGAEGKTVHIATTPFNAAWPVFAQNLVTALNSIGLDAQLETLSRPKYLQLFADPDMRREYDIFATDYGAAFGDPLSVLAASRTGAGENYASWSDPEYDQALDAALAADDAERPALTAKVQQILNDQLPWMPLYNADLAVWTGKKITQATMSDSFQWAPWANKIGGAPAS